MSKLEKKLYKFAEDGNFKKINELFEEENGGVKIDINWTNPKENGNTPLHVALNNSHYLVVEFLLANGATVNKVNDDGKTPLHIACKKYGRSSIVKLLIEKGANVNEPEHNAFENTPLHLAAMNKSDFGFLGSNKGNEENEEIATILLEAGGNPEVKNAKGYTVMELAESRRNHWVVEILKTFPQKKLHRATIGLLITQKRKNALSKTEHLSEAFKTLSNQDLNHEIKSFLGGKKRSEKSKKANRKTRRKK